VVRYKQDKKPLPGLAHAEPFVSHHEGWHIDRLRHGEPSLLRRYLTALEAGGARRLRNESFFSAPQLKRHPLGGAPFMQLFVADDHGGSPFVGVHPDTDPGARSSPSISLIRPSPWKTPSRLLPSCHSATGYVRGPQVVIANVNGGHLRIIARADTLTFLFLTPITFSSSRRVRRSDYVRISRPTSGQPGYSDHRHLRRLQSDPSHERSNRRPSSCEWHLARGIVSGAFKHSRCLVS